MRLLLAATALTALFAAACDGPVECGDDPRGTLRFPTCADLDQERQQVVNESEAAMLDRCYQEQCTENAPAEEG